MDGDQSVNKTDKKMKIMAGMGTIEDYPDFVQAGADEIFIGYVPFFWIEKYGTRIPLNRREVLYYNVQIGSYSELLILAKMVEYYKVAVTIAINSLSYPKQAYRDILAIMKECIKAGFDRFILADPKLLESINFYRKRNKDFSPRIVISGEYGEMNEALVKDLIQKGVSRIIFPRQTMIEEMGQIILANPSIEYEAFALNEKCHYTGAYCNSLHCDELCHMCKIPYVFAEAGEIRYPVTAENDIEYAGESGCGMCALWRLFQVGITHLKIVSRGNSGQATMQDLHFLQRGIKILEDSSTEEEYIERMKAELFPRGCSGNCYYLDVACRIDYNKTE